MRFRLQSYKAKINKLINLGLINRLTNRVRKTLIAFYNTKIFYTSQKLFGWSLLIEIMSIY